MKNFFAKHSLLTNILLIIIFSLPPIFALFNEGFFVTDDGEWMIIRFSAFYQALADGQFPVRFLHRLNFDFGYPVATFLYPGFMYAAVPLHLLKIGVAESVKILFGVSFVVGAILTYFWLFRVFNNKSAAFVAAVTSLYVPYHLYDMYTRGSVGEIFAMLWVPFIFWMLEKKNSPLVAFGIFLLIISHNTLALLFLPVIFLYAWIRKTLSLRSLLLSFFLGIGLSSFFIIPAIYELRFTPFSQTTISDPTKYFADLSLIGISTLLIFILAGVLFIFQKKSRKEDLLIQFFLIITFLATFLSSSYSEFIWKIIPAPFIQFPFRFLSLLVVSLPFISAFIVSEINETKKKTLVSVGIVLVLLFASLNYLTPKDFFDKGEGFYVTNEATTTVKDEYMPLWVKEKPDRRADKKIEVVKGEALIKDIFYNNKSIAFAVDAQEDAMIRVNTVYWPGWKIFINNQQAEITYNNPKGLIEFEVKKGNNRISAEFGETGIRLLSDLVSLVSFGILLLMSYRFKRR